VTNFEAKEFQYWKNEEKSDFNAKFLKTNCLTENTNIYSSKLIEPQSRLQYFTPITSYLKIKIENRQTI